MEIKENDYIISVVVGYMLKLMKLGINTIKFKEEFNAIKHGNYDEFIKLIGVNEPPMIVYNNNNIKTSGFSQKSGDCDFIMILAAGSALKCFYKECKNKYGDIIDSDISDEIYKNLATFEISLRMYSNNENIIKPKESLENVINKLADFKNLSENEKCKLHKGRDFLNYVKHKTKNFNSYKEGILFFNDAYNVLIENNLLIENKIKL